MGRGTLFSVSVCITILVSWYDTYLKIFLSIKRFVFYYKKTFSLKILKLKDEEKQIYTANDKIANLNPL